MSKPKTKRPTRAEMDERVKVPLTPTELAEGLLKAGKHPEDEDDRERACQQPDD